MLESAGNIINDSLDRLSNIKFENDGDFYSEGILHCWKCGEAKQAWIDWNTDENGMPKKTLVPVMCKCDREAYDAAQKKEQKLKFETNLASARERLGIHQRDAAKHIFADDDSPNSAISRACRKYVKEWDNMRENNLGILFFGNKGTGKSFYAACIANALAERQVMTAMTTTALIMNVLSGQWDRATVISSLNHFDLLVLDDLGAERDTTFGAEIMFSIIDSRYRSKRPLIVTTNMDVADMQQEGDIWRARIYDRVLEMCPITLKMEGDSRRQAIADERRNMARDFLKNAKIKS